MKKSPHCVAGINNPLCSVMEYKSLAIPMLLFHRYSITCGMGGGRAGAETNRLEESLRGKCDWEEE